MFQGWDVPPAEGDEPPRCLPHSWAPSSVLRCRKGWELSGRLRGASSRLRARDNECRDFPPCTAAFAWLGLAGGVSARRPPQPHVPAYAAL